MRPSAQDGLAGICEAAAKLLADNGRALLTLSDLSDAPARVIAADSVDEAVVQSKPFLVVTRLETVPAQRWRLTAQAEMMRHARAAAQGGRLAARLGHFVAGMACAGLSLAANLACWRRRWRDGQGAGSTVLIHLRRTPVAPGPGNIIRQASPWTA
jgi:hypothetical protein